MPNFIEIGQISLEKGSGGSLGLGHNFFVTDGQKRDYLSRDPQCARGTTKNVVSLEIGPVYSCRDSWCNMQMFLISPKKLQLLSSQYPDTERITTATFFGYWTDIDQICTRCSDDIVIKYF